MWMRAEVQLATPPIGYVGIELGGGQVCVAQHLLHRPQVGAALQEVRRKGMTEEMRVHALRIEARLLGQSAEDQEGAGARQRAALRVEEQLGPVPPVEVRPPAR